MAGQLTIDTLKASSGVLATQNGMTGIAKAWVNFTGNTGAGVIQSSFNVSSVTYAGTGSYVTNFTTSMPNATYSVVSAVQTVNLNGAVRLDTLSVGSCAFRVGNTSNVAVDAGIVCISVFSS